MFAQLISNEYFGKIMTNHFNGIFEKLNLERI